MFYSDTEKKQIKKQNRLIANWKKSKRPKKKKKHKAKKYENLSYNQLIKLPEWKKRRNQILIRDNYTCQNCGQKIHLEVHHITYRYKYPWLSPNEDLIILCEICHAKIHNIT